MRHPHSAVDGVLAALHILATEAMTTILPDAIGVFPSDLFERRIGRSQCPGLRVLPVRVRLAHLGTQAGHAGRRQAVHRVIDNGLLHIVADLNFLVVEGVFGPDLFPLV